MKEWFKYRYGFINIDENNLYFTKTGNWSETVGLEEKNENVFKKADYSQKLKAVIYLTLVGGLLLTALIFNLVSGNISYVLIVGLIFSGYTVYNYMIPEMGDMFVLPKEKLLNISLKENVIIIRFIDANTNEMSHRLIGLSDQGREFLLSLGINTETRTAK